MNFRWDPEKSASTFVLRGFDFAFAALIFDGASLDRPDLRREYGEPRRIAVGRADGVLLTVVYTDRDLDGMTERRIISARRSNARERQAYDKAFPVR